MDVDNLPGYGLGYRHIQVGLIFSMVVVMHIITLSTPVVIVAITTPDTSPNPSIPSYPNWTDQSLVLISYYWGNGPALLLGGPLCRKYKTKWFMVGSMLIASLISFSTPSVIEAFGSTALMVCYFIQGLCQGITTPMLSDFISKWVPLSELTTIGTWIFAGISLGSVFATEISGVLSSSWLGWPSVFYFSATIGLIWCIFMVTFGCPNPDEHKSITLNELEFIKRGKRLTKKRIPWSEILKSAPTWATWIDHVSFIWVSRLCTSELPTYMNRVLGFNVATGSNILAIIYLIAYLNTFVISGVSQYLIKKNYLTVGSTRKLCSSLASWGTSLNLIILGTFTFSSYTTLIFIFFIFLCINAGFSGFNINYNDLSPNFSACLLGVGGLSATLVSFIPVTLVQFMVPDQESRAEWGGAFWLAAIVASIGNSIFVWKAKGDIQEWDHSDSTSNSSDRESYLDIDKESLIASEKSELCKTQ